MMFDGGKQLWMQFVFALAIIGWTAATVAAVLLAIKLAGIELAYDLDVQAIGMDANHDRAKLVGSPRRSPGRPGPGRRSPRR